jgi:hypothetical protein
MSSFWYPRVWQLSPLWRNNLICRVQLIPAYIDVSTLPKISKGRRPIFIKIGEKGTKTTAVRLIHERNWSLYWVQPHNIPWKLANKIWCLLVSIRLVPVLRPAVQLHTDVSTFNLILEYLNIAIFVQRFVVVVRTYVLVRTVRGIRI